MNIDYIIETLSIFDLMMWANSIKVGVDIEIFIDRQILAKDNL